MKPATVTTTHPAATLDAFARTLLVELCGARANVSVGRCFGVRHREQWSRYVSGTNAPTTRAVQGWIDHWDLYVEGTELPRLELTWNGDTCSAEARDDSTD